MPSIHSVARQQHLKQERKEKMNNQITLKQLLLVATTEDISVYLKDVNCMDINIQKTTIETTYIPISIT